MLQLNTPTVDLHLFNNVTVTNKLYDKVCFQNGNKTQLKATCFIKIYIFWVYTVGTYPLKMLCLCKLPMKVIN